MMSLAERAYAVEPPPGWQDTFDTWLRIWRGSNRELDRNPYSCRATLVNHTSYARLRELLAVRAEHHTPRCGRCGTRPRDVVDGFYCEPCRDRVDQERLDARFEADEPDE